MSRRSEARSTPRGARMTLLLSLAALTAACGAPADKKMVTDSGQEQYRTSLDAIDQGLTPHERDAFNWAVAGLDLQALNQRYPNASVRQVVRGQVARVREVNPEQIRALKEQEKRQLATVTELGKVTATDATLETEDSFFGPKSTIKARIVNASSLPLGQASWSAALYINGQSQPVAQSTVRSDFRTINGLKPGQEISTRLNLGFVRGEQSWSTLAITQASSRRVDLVLMPETALDYNDKPYITSDYRKSTDLLEAQMKQADRFADI